MNPEGPLKSSHGSEHQYPVDTQPAELGSQPLTSPRSTPDPVSQVAAANLPGNVAPNATTPLAEMKTTPEKTSRFQRFLRIFTGSGNQVKERTPAEAQHVHSEVVVLPKNRELENNFRIEIENGHPIATTPSLSSVDSDEKKSSFISNLKSFFTSSGARTVIVRDLGTPDETNAKKEVIDDIQKSIKREYKGKYTDCNVLYLNVERNKNPANTLSSFFGNIGKWCSETLFGKANTNIRNVPALLEYTKSTALNLKEALSVSDQLQDEKIGEFDQIIDCSNALIKTGVDVEDLQSIQKVYDQVVNLEYLLRDKEEELFTDLKTKPLELDVLLEKNSSLNRSIRNLEMLIEGNHRNKLNYQQQLIAKNEEREKLLAKIDPLAESISSLHEQHAKVRQSRESVMQLRRVFGSQMEVEGHSLPLGEIPEKPEDNAPLIMDTFERSLFGLRYMTQGEGSNDLEFSDKLYEAMYRLGVAAEDTSTTLFDDIKGVDGKVRTVYEYENDMRIINNQIKSLNMQLKNASESDAKSINREIVSLLQKRQKIIGPVLQHIKFQVPRNSRFPERQVLLKQAELELERLLNQNDFMHELYGGRPVTPLKEMMSFTLLDLKLGYAEVLSSSGGADKNGSDLSFSVAVQKLIGRAGSLEAREKTLSHLSNVVDYYEEDAPVLNEKMKDHQTDFEKYWKSFKAKEEVGESRWVRLNQQYELRKEYTNTYLENVGKAPSDARLSNPLNPNEIHNELLLPFVKDNTGTVVQLVKLTKDNNQNGLTTAGKKFLNGTQ